MRSKRWNPGNNDLDGLLFEGSPALLRQLDDLVIRPRSWWRETLLPIIYLVRQPTASNPLDGLADRLRQARGVLHSRINGQEAPLSENDKPSEDPIRQLLDGVVADLSQRSGHGRPLKFPHYSLAVWLASLITNRTGPHPIGRRVDDAFQDFIKERYRLQNKTTNAEVSLINEFPWWVRFLVLLLPPLGIQLMRTFWRPPQWAARNRITSKHSSGSFRGLARKFTEQGSGERGHGIQQAEVDRLLVDAFMEDLRQDYRRTTLFGVGRRRTTYPILLIDNIKPTTTSSRLVELLGDSRTEYLRKEVSGPGRPPRERAYFHPLLIFAEGERAALDSLGIPNYSSEQHGTYSVAEIRYYYSEWLRALTNSDRTWLVPLNVPAGTAPQGGLRTELTETPLPDAPRPAMTFVVAFLLISAASFTAYSTYYTHCGAWYWEPQLQRQTLTPDRNQCIGLGSSDHRFFDDLSDVVGIAPEIADDLKEVEEEIHRVNAAVAQDPRHLTVVYLSDLTSQDSVDYPSELERLRGIAVAQDRNRTDQPVRVLLANAGDGMEYGKAAAEAIVREAREDDTLVAVVGLGISREGTRDALIRLDEPDARIPTIGTSISATDLATNTTSYYHQVGPTNQRQADVGAFYAETQLGTRNVTIYHSGDDEDLYSNDLKNQAKRAFEARGITVREQPYRTRRGDDGLDTNLAGRDACDVGPEGVVFYTGRSEQLRVFLQGMQSRCEGSYPDFVGGDSVERFVLDGGLDEFPGFTIDYLTPASSLAWGPNCSGATDIVGFFVNYQKLFNENEEACASTRGGGSILAYDTLQVFTQGVRNTLVLRPTPDAVLAGIDDISSDGFGDLSGASGQIDYPRTGGEQAIPKDKAILVLRGQASVQPERRLLCGQHETAQPPPNECPALRP